MTLLVAGWVAVDEVETPFVRRSEMLGGSATPAALAAALFTDVRLLAAVGEDFPDAFREQLGAARIDLEGLETIPGGTTSRWGGRYHYDMNTRDTVYTELGVNADWVPALPEAWADCTTAFLAAADPVVQRELMAGLRSASASMVDTIRLYMDSMPAEVMKTLAAADFVCLNDSEARELAGTPSVATAARKLVANGAGGAAVKLGEYGAVFVSNDDYFAAAGYPLETVLDPTGAGDAFAGAFMGFVDSAGELSPGVLRRATVYGCTVASYQVEGYGPERLLTLTRDEVEARYREMRSLTIFGAEE